ncbi:MULTISPECIES: SDR family NAD(P)-dependent oxidoreductase [unclassified Pseudofrankia]|uniref:SDR family NAD(P)-dependent oxidoreductase n=1 Tax=unclassified Pseudofrankia TaxID=2994372 RepID=UPI0008DB2ABA|nr:MULTISPECIES: SDR family oxidoreductase [unclassified Pseudofrankia]MDT3444693.1 SDR family oxidoreductase [Pseudofrankia sp. BMG5.37]OHV66569.1 2-deoxy-D-gluconate 3-dehydrogenase [Pseudofrankia sp. BMG5.36]
MNLFDLAGRHVVVTGAGRGLGRAMAEAVAAAGARVTLVARSESQLAESAAAVEHAGGTACVRRADLSDLDAVADLARELSTGQVHGVVHAAGVTHRADARDFDDEVLRRVLTVNLEAPIVLSRELMRHRADDVPSSHVFVGSLGSSIGLPRALAYVASKAGVLGVVRTLAAEWATSGVRVNAISPGYFRTALTADLLDQPDELSRIEGRIPMRRLGRPAELGGATIFLLSDASSYVTGQQIVVDGGWLAS